MFWTRIQTEDVSNVGTEPKLVINGITEPTGVKAGT